MRAHWGNRHNRNTGKCRLTRTRWKHSHSRGKWHQIHEETATKQNRKYKPETPIHNTGSNKKQEHKLKTITKENHTPKTLTALRLLPRVSSGLACVAGCWSHFWWWYFQEWMAVYVEPPILTACFSFCMFCHKVEHFWGSCERLILSIL